MRKYIYIAMGGLAGAILRYWIRTVPSEGWTGSFPAGTLAVNLIGCFALGLIMTLALETAIIGAPLRLGITTGFLGALTTFATLCKELVSLARQDLIVIAIIYGLASLVLGFGCVYAGTWLARPLLSRRRIPAGTVGESEE